jgi:hypothetical protein
MNVFGTPVHDGMENKSNEIVGGIPREAERRII